MMFSSLNFVLKCELCRWPGRAAMSKIWHTHREHALEAGSSQALWTLGRYFSGESVLL